MTIANILHGKPHRLISVAPDESLQHAAEVLTRERIGALLVLKPNGDIAGIISERDIIRAVGVNGADVLARPVAELMTKEVTCCVPEDTPDQVMAIMTEEAEAESQAMREYIARG